MYARTDPGHHARPMPQTALPSTWLDMVVALPAFGVLLDPGFEFQEETKLRFSPLLNRWSKEGRRAQVSVDESDADTTVRVRSGGVAVAVSRRQLVFEFNDSARLRAAPGK